MATNITYDPSADAARIQLSEHAVVDSEEVSEGIILEFDEDGHLAGIEVLQASKRLASDALGSASKITA